MPVSPSPTYSTMYSSMRVCEDLIKVYPTRFHDIEAAKDYIAYKCGYDLENTFDNKLVFLVAIKAYDSKEFYLEILPPNRNALRNAIEFAIAILLPQIHTWPKCFVHVGEAKTFVAKSTRGVGALTFPGVEQDKFQHYVLFNTARHAWEQYKFEMRVVPEDWRRKPVPTPTNLSVADAVELDISRLAPLMTPWPPRFIDLNAARNHVQQVCYAMYFRYTYHPDVEKRRFRLYVHFNTAKYALSDGKFKVDIVGQEKRVMVTKTSGLSNITTPRVGGRPVLRKAQETEDTTRDVSPYDAWVEKETAQERFSVSTAAYGPATKKWVPFVRTSYEFKKRASVAAPSTAGTETADMNDKDKENDPPLTPTDSMEPLTTTKATVAEEQDSADMTAIESKESIDPFKALVAELRREFVLKLAFD